MDIRESFSRLKKKFKRAGRKRKPEGTGTDSGGESVNPAGLLSRPVSHIVAGSSRSRDDNGSDADVRREYSIGRLPTPSMQESVSARGGDDCQGGKEGGVDGWEESQRHSHLHSDIEVAVGSESGQGGNGVNGENIRQVDLSPSTPSIMYSGKPDSMWALRFWLPVLTVSSDDVETSTIPHHVLDIPHPGVKQGIVMDDSETGWKYTDSATTKLLCGVKDSVNAFVPLKSIAGHLCVILGNCEVCPPPPIYPAHSVYSHSSKQGWMNNP